MHSQIPDMDETKEHVMAAGREIIMAAQGALRFCKAYVEYQAPSKSQPHLVNFFQKAISVADELATGLLKASPIKKAAESVAGPLFDVMEREMKSEARKVRRRAKPKPKAKRATRKKVAKKKTAPKKMRRK
jgi:hypothetical protein